MSTATAAPAPSLSPLGRAALVYAADGIPVFPLAEGTKVPTKGSRGFYDATTDPLQIISWWAEYPNANIGTPNGQASGRDVIDEDPRNGGNVTSLHLPPTRTVLTPSGGRHFHFLHPGGLIPKDNKGKLGTGIDALCDGAYVVLPPSIVGGRAYRWVDEDQPIAELPSRIVMMLLPPARPDPERPPAQPRTGAQHHTNSAEKWLTWAMERTGEGRGDATGHGLAVQLLIAERNGEAVDVYGTLLEYARRATLDPSDPFTERDVDRWLKSAEQSDLVRRAEPARSQVLVDAAPRFRERQQQASPGQRPEPDRRSKMATAQRTQTTYLRTEMGNAQRLLDKCGGDFVFSPALGFCAWNGRHWQADAELIVRGWAQEVVLDMYREATELANAGLAAAQGGDEEKGKELAQEAATLLKWAVDSQKERMVGAMVNLAKPHRVVEVDIFDAKPMLFNWANGTLDLNTGTMRPHRRDDYLMQCSPIAYKPGTPHPTIDKFIDAITLADDESRADAAERRALAAYLQRALGYCLTGDTNEQAWHLLVGEGENGKTTLVDAISYVLGPYSGMMAAESVTITGRPRDGSAPSPDIAALRGKRFTAIPETEEGARLAPARIKQLSGSDKLPARLLHKNIFEFFPTHKLWIHTNHRPEARETKHAFWRRVRYIPFDLNLREHPDRKDQHLPAKLRAEAEGIAAWLVEGCMEWRKRGLDAPRIVLEATAAYKHDMDVMAAFLSECCVIDKGASERASVLWARWQEWCRENNEREGKQRGFGTALAERGFTKHTNNGVVWDGLRLRRPDDSPPSDHGTTEPSNASRGNSPHASACENDFLRTASNGSVVPLRGEGAPQPADSAGDDDGFVFEVVTDDDPTPSRDEPCAACGRSMWRLSAGAWVCGRCGVPHRGRRPGGDVA